MAPGRSSPTSGHAAPSRSSPRRTRYGGALADGRLVIERGELRAARDRLPAADRARTRPGDRARDDASRRASDRCRRRRRSCPGIEIERRWLPLDRVGCYVPGGSAPYPSSLVMTVVPARVAGVGEIVVASPADAAGAVHPVLLGAAGPARGRRPARRRRRPGDRRSRVRAPGRRRRRSRAVDRIVGPGNAWVTAAKLEVAGIVGIDLPGRSVGGHGPRRRRRRSRARRRRPRHPGRARPRLAGDPRDDEPALADAVEREIARPPARASSGANPRPRPRGPWPDRDRAGPRRGDRLRRRLRPRAPLDRCPRSGRRRRPDPPRRLDLRRAVGAGVRRRLRDRREPRPARPAASPARRDPLGGRGVRALDPDPAGRRAAAWPRSARPSAGSPRPRA